MAMLRDKEKFWSRDLCLQLCAGQSCRRTECILCGQNCDQEGEKARRDFRWIKKFLTVKEGLPLDVNHAPLPQPRGQRLVQDCGARSGDPLEQWGRGCAKVKGEDVPPHTSRCVFPVLEPSGLPQRCAQGHPAASPLLDPSSPRPSEF